ncbi:hypothetical protein [Pontibacter sp. G13]|uniref:hypothetical protein n=1 Tax=Pontibacter sp. G13 TaxID=3074898 RepID=UPI00288A8C62|nr:hypothetical protein [Pontibacter sp. G13]WNJ17883.1 hypothetical protein RJD25_23770 [Pontibacter sp. G13]
MLDSKYRARLENAHIRIFDYPDMGILVKAPGSGGNAIPNWQSGSILVMNKQGALIEEVHSDCPHVSISKEVEGFCVSVWDWVPGPGPGDFEIRVASEEEAVELAWDYFFGKNPYFLERKKHEEDSAK